MKKDQNSEWKEIERRFRARRKIRLHFMRLWKEIKPFVEELIIYLFVLLAFELCFRISVFYFFDPEFNFFKPSFWFAESNDQSSQPFELSAEIKATIALLRGALIICMSALFAFHLLMAFVVNWFSKITRLLRRSGRAARIELAIYSKPEKKP